ncbi:hypothetical protein [Acidihalobacter prosperus]|uniref:hypothetical protein n=1 Tax=Acidihalobacter prosperus TaxID=160660 RepID=UPI0009ED528F|nr:hypothetical protein [Acidihalobacter prosperus]
MTPYLNLNGNSNVLAFEATEDSILVVFKSGACRKYLYNTARPGGAVVERMKVLAVQGRGLNSYINTTVKDRYANKW